MGLPKENKITLQYTTINHNARIQLGLTNNEYCLADSYYHLSKNPEYQEKGCVTADEDLANFIGVTRRTVISLKKRLIEKGIVEKTSYGGYTTTAIWYTKVIVKEEGVKDLHSKGDKCEETSQGCEDVSQACEDTSHNNNIYNNNYNNEEVDKSTSPESEEKVSSKKVRIRKNSVPWQWRDEYIQLLKENLKLKALDKSTDLNKWSIQRIFFNKIMDEGESMEDVHEAFKFFISKIPEASYWSTHIKSFVDLERNFEKVRQDIKDSIARKSQGKGGNSYEKR